MLSGVRSSICGVACNLQCGSNTASKCLFRGRDRIGEVLREELPTRFSCGLEAHCSVCLLVPHYRFLHGSFDVLARQSACPSARACVQPCRIHLHVGAQRFIIIPSRPVESSALVIRVPFAIRADLHSANTARPRTAIASSWDLTKLTCCATFACFAALSYFFLLLPAVAFRVVSVLSLPVAAGELASVFRSQLSVAGSVSYWLPAQRCVSLSAACMVVGPRRLASPTRVPMCPHCHLMILMIRVATVWLKSCIGGQFLQKLTVRAFLSAPLLQLSRSSRPEFRSGRLWVQRLCHFHRLTHLFVVVRSRWALSLGVGVVRRRCVVRVCLFVPRFRCFSFSFSRLGSRLGSLFWFAQLPQGACRLLHLHSVRLFLHNELLSVVCQHQCDCHHSVDHRARSVDRSARPFRGPCRACTRHSRLALRQLPFACSSSLLWDISVIKF